MLIDLTLRNFKIWRTTGVIRLAQVTLLLGTNSSGKSSLIQSLLLIRQTVRSKEPNVSLHFGVEGVDSVALGNFADVLCRYSPDSEIGIEFTWAPQRRQMRAYLFSGEYTRNRTGAAVVSALRLGIGDRGFTVKRQERGAFKLWVGSKKKPLGSSAEYHPQNSFTFSAAALAKLPPEESAEIRDVGRLLLAELERIIYLGPVRHLARRYYTWDGVPPSSLGDDGDRAIDALIASAMTPRKKEMEGPSLLEQTGHWLLRMGLATGLEVKRVGRSPLYEIVVNGEDSCSNLKDVGVGVSQVLPVIVACLHASSGHIVMVEEPESHLHPLAQSVLAELFAHVTRERKIQVIAETHSEHLFRRLQTLIAREELPPSRCASYFVKRNGNQACLQVLEVDAYGRIKNWPDKFFGDSLGETREQTDLMLAKLKLLKANAQTD